MANTVKQFGSSKKKGNPSFVKGHQLGFKKGETGNPNGRPKKDKCITDLIGEILAQPCDYILPGVPIGQKTWAELLAWAILLSAVKGNTTSQTEILNRREGKVKDLVDLTTKGESIKGNGYVIIPEQSYRDAFVILAKAGVNSISLS